MKNFHFCAIYALEFIKAFAMTAEELLINPVHMEQIRKEFEKEVLGKVE